MDDKYIDEIAQGRIFAEMFETYRWSFSSENYRDLIFAYQNFRRAIESNKSFVTEQ